MKTKDMSIPKIIFIEYLNKDKGYKPDKIYFNTYEDAIQWGRDNIHNFNTDFIHIEF